MCTGPVYLGHLYVRYVSTKFCEVGRYLKHLSSTLTVRGGDERRVQIQEAVRLEEVMRRPGESIPDARHSADGVGARPQVHQASEKLPCSTAQVRLALPVSCT